MELRAVEVVEVWLSVLSPSPTRHPARPDNSLWVNVETDYRFTQFFCKMSAYF